MTMQPRSTRERVRAAVSQEGPVTARELAEGLDLTPAAVRRHLDVLAAEGVITEHEHDPAGHRGRGRPARAWVLSDAGHTTLPTAYDGMALEILDFLRETQGEQAVQEYAERRARTLAARHAERVSAAGEDPRDRAEALADALREDGFAATLREVPQAAGVQLCQGHCPVQHVAEEFPVLCDAEAEAFSELLGVHVQRLQTLPAGGHVCTTFVPVGTVIAPRDGTGPGDQTTETPTQSEERSR
ncbi:helix-turn-helix transcriptional regulator [Kytococcus aerolatus]|nr:ArsR family transcriptional regulator [Kytococcus aerolatus]